CGMIACATRRRSGSFCALLTAALALDIVDGVLARRLSPPGLLRQQRVWDGRVDALVYVAVPLCVLRLRPDVLRTHRHLAALFVVAHLLDAATGLWKWHRLPRYHSWSFKYSAGAMGFTLPTLLIGEGDGRLFRMALGAAILSHGENIAITCAMRTWSSDVPSL